MNDYKESTLENGAISGAIEGSYNVSEDGRFVTITTADVTYKGVAVEMKDEAGNDTLCISAVGDNNHSIWAVKYLAPAEE